MFRDDIAGTIGVVLKENGHKRKDLGRVNIIPLGKLAAPKGDNIQ